MKVRWCESSASVLFYFLTKPCRWIDGKKIKFTGFNSAMISLSSGKNRNVNMEPIVT